MALYGSLSALTSRAMACVMAEKLPMVLPCSVALCHVFSSVNDIKTTARVTQKMVREANKEAAWAEVLAEKEAKRQKRQRKPKYDYTNPSFTAGKKKAKEVNYQKQVPFTDVESDRVVNDDNMAENTFAKRDRVNKVKDHIYYNIYPWKNATELAEHLIRTKIYEDKHCLVLNKPVGVLHEHPVKTTGARCYGRPPPVTYSLLDALPTMKQITGARELRLCHAPEKWNSGVTVYAKHSSAQQILLYHCRSTANQLGISNKQFWALTRYSPQPVVQGRRRAGCMFENFQDNLVPVLVNKASKSANKRGSISAFYVDHTTVASSLETGIALVQCGVTSTKRFALRVWLSHCLAPVLGDHLLGGRVGELMGHAVPIPYSRVTIKQRLNYDILQRLELTPSTQDLLPLFVHLRSVILPNYHNLVAKVKEERRHKYPNGDPYYDDEVDQLLSKERGDEEVQEEGRSHNKANEEQNHIEENSNDLVFTAPLPEHFLWTMERLGISLEEDDIFGYSP